MTVQGPVKKQQPDGMSHRGSLICAPCHLRCHACSPGLLQESSNDDWEEENGNARAFVVPKLFETQGKRFKKRDLQVQFDGQSSAGFLRSHSELDGVDGSSMFSPEQSMVGSAVNSELSAQRSNALLRGPRGQAQFGQMTKSLSGVPDLHPGHFAFGRLLLDGIKVCSVGSGRARSGAGSGHGRVRYVRGQGRIG